LEGTGDRGVYQTFGRALGEENGVVMDVHGAGAVREDPKSGDRDDYPASLVGYQGDIQYVYNYVRVVRDINIVDSPDLTYPIVETNTSICYNDELPIDCPVEGESFYGQDGNYEPIAYVSRELSLTNGPTATPSGEPSYSPTNGPTSTPSTDLR